MSEEETTSGSVGQPGEAPDPEEALPKRSIGGLSQQRLRLLLTALGAAVVIVLAIVAVTQLTGGKSSPANGGTVTLKDVTQSSALLKGIAQREAELGNPNAPVVIIEFADFQCPICALWAQNVLPTIVKRYVRPGKVMLIFQGLHFLDQNFGTTDSEQVLRLALSAGRQNHLWDVVELAYHNQGKEGSGWATPAMLRSIAQAVPGLNAKRTLAGRSATTITRSIASSDAFASRSGVSGTPSFLIGKGKNLKLYASYGDVPSFEQVLDTLLKQ
ncbi:MAG: DsbA family protein [Gaiellaceae bacterium]